jgi:hypothetical protein
VSYSQRGSRDGYRTDCSGFASYAWQVKNSKGQLDNPDGIRLANDYGVNVSFNALQPGDIINNMRPGNSGHVVIFVRWVTTGTKFEAYEENAYYGKAVNTTLTLESLKTGGTTIKEYEPYAPGPYYAYRYKNIPGFASVVNGLSLSSSSPKVNEYITASFTIRNDGGQTIFITQLTAGARGPGATNAKYGGWGAPVVDFPTIKSITLQPGQTYYYSQSRPFTKGGDYFAEPVKDENGWGGIYPWPRQYFNVK